MPKWFSVAKNEYRIHTSAIRTIRPHFPFIVIVFLGSFVIFVAPAVINLFIDDFLAILLSQAAVALVEIILFILFIYLMIFPIANTLREVETKKVEIYLAAPVKPSDILLGEYLGMVPFYAIGFSIISGFFIAALNPLGLDLLQMAIIVMIFVITFLSALWIGSVVAAILRTKIGKAVYLKDVGRALSIILALPLVALMYAIIGGNLLEALIDPNTNGLVKTVLGFFPSSWGAEVIIGFANNPSNISLVAFETLIRLAGLVTFFIGVLWLGTKVANVAYRLEPTTFISPMAKKDRIFYNALRYLGGSSSFGILIVSAFKDYVRRLENISWLVYMIALVAFIAYFNLGGGGITDWPGAPLKGLSLLSIPMISGFVVGTVSRGKEEVLIYQKTPSGINKFILSRLIQSCLIAVPTSAMVIALSTIYVPQFTIIHLIANIVWASLRTIAVVSMILGLAILIPTFSEESRTRAFGVMINLQLVLFATIGVEIGLSELGLRLSRIFTVMDKFTGLLYDYLLVTIIFLLISIMLLVLGKRKISRIE
jgi:hypothetical protein